MRSSLWIAFLLSSTVTASAWSAPGDSKTQAPIDAHIEAPRKVRLGGTARIVVTYSSRLEDARELRIRIRLPAPQDRGIRLGRGSSERVIRGHLKPDQVLTKKFEVRITSPGEHLAAIDLSVKSAGGEIQSRTMSVPIEGSAR